MENYDNESVTFVAWPEIKGLHNVLTSLEKSAAAEKLLGQPIMPLHIAFTKPLLYRGKVKLHGTLHLPPPNFHTAFARYEVQASSSSQPSRRSNNTQAMAAKRSRWDRKSKGDSSYSTGYSSMLALLLRGPAATLESIRIRSLHNLQSIYTPTG